MPFIHTTNVDFEKGKYILKNTDELIKKFPFLENRHIRGKIVSIHIDGIKTKINKNFHCKLFKHNENFYAEIQEPSPFKEKGLPPCDALIIFSRYIQPRKGEENEELPIMEKKLLKGTIYHFDDEVKKLIKEEEIGIILESVIFHQKIKSLASNLKHAFLSFEEDNFASAKTSCRKILEKLRDIISNWKSIDESSSLCDKFKSILKSLFSFASIGGPHEGVITEEETDLILKNTYSILLYVNSILKNDRYKPK